MRLVRSLYDAAARDDLDGFLDCLDPDVEWTDLPLGPSPGKHLGHDDMRAWFDAQRRLVADGAQVRIPITYVRTAGNMVVVSGPGAEMPQEGGGFNDGAAWLFEIGDGKVTRMVAFRDRDEALEVAGISE